MNVVTIEDTSAEIEVGKTNGTRPVSIAARFFYKELPADYTPDVIINNIIAAGESMEVIIYGSAN